MQQPIHRRAHLIAAALIGMLLSACGGGGGGNRPTASAPAVSCTASVTDAGNAPSLSDSDSVTLRGSLDACTANQYRIDLVAGTFYEFKVEGKASHGGTSENPALSVLDANQALFMSADDTIIFTTQETLNPDPHIGFTAPLTGTYYLRVAASDSRSGGSYTLTASRYRIDDLVPSVLFASTDPTHRWNTGSPLGTPVTRKYTFLTDAAPLAPYGYSGFVALTPSQQQAVKKILAYYSAIANITFVEVTTATEAQLRFALMKMPTDSVGRGIQQEQDNPDGSVLYQDILLNTIYFAGEAEGGQAVEDWIHEIGHALGLKHPGKYSSITGINDAPFIPIGFDNTKFSVMSYLRHPDYPWGDTSSVTPSLVDIAAVQYLYGANLSAHGQKHVFTFSNSQPFVMSLISSGADDTIDASNQTLPATLNLVAGSFSSIGASHQGKPAHDNVAIPVGATVYDAIGGKGNDTINGNELDNAITGGPGDDRIDGAGGANTAVYLGRRVDFSVKRNGSGFTVTDKTGTEGTDTLIRIQRIKFSDTPAAIDINSAVTE